MLQAPVIQQLKLDKENAEKEVSRLTNELVGASREKGKAEDMALEAEGRVEALQVDIDSKKKGSIQSLKRSLFSL